MGAIGDKGEVSRVIGEVRYSFRLGPVSEGEFMSLEELFCFSADDKGAIAKGELVDSLVGNRG